MTKLVLRILRAKSIRRRINTLKKRRRETLANLLKYPNDPKLLSKLDKLNELIQNRKAKLKSLKHVQVSEANALGIIEVEKL